MDLDLFDNIIGNEFTINAVEENFMFSRNFHTLEKIIINCNLHIENIIKEVHRLQTHEAKYTSNSHAELLIEDLYNYMKTLNFEMESRQIEDNNNKEMYIQNITYLIIELNELLNIEKQKCRSNEMLLSSMMGFIEDLNSLLNIKDERNDSENFSLLLTIIPIKEKLQLLLKENDIKLNDSNNKAHVLSLTSGEEEYKNESIIINELLNSLKIQFDEETGSQNATITHLKSENDKLNKENKFLTEELAQLRSKFEEINREKENLEVQKEMKDIDQLKRDLMIAHQLLEEQKGQIDSWKTEMQSNVKLVGELKGQLEFHQGTMSSLNSEIMDTRNQLSSRTTELEAMIEDYLKMSEELDCVKLDISMCKELLECRTGEFHQSLGQISNDFNELKRLGELKSEMLEDQLSKYQMDLDVIRIELKISKVEKESLQIEFKTLQNCIREKDDQLKEKCEEIEHLNRSLNDLRKEKEEFISENQEKREILEKQVSNSQLKLDQIQGNLKIINDEKENLQMYVKNKDDELKEKNEEIEHLNKSLEVQREEMAGIIDSFSQTKINTKVLEDQLSKYQLELGQVKKKLDADINEKEKLKIQLETFQKCIEEKNDQLKEKKEEMKQLNNTLDNLRNDLLKITELVGQNKITEDQIYKCELELDQVRSDLKVSGIEKERLNFELETIQKCNEEKDKQLCEMRSEIEQLNNSLEVMREELIKITEEFNNNKFSCEPINKDNEEINNLKIELESMKEKQEKSELKFKSHSNELHALKYEHELWQQKVRQANQNLLKEKQKHNTIKGKLESKIETLEVQLLESKSCTKKCEEEIEKMKINLKSKEVQVAKTKEKSCTKNCEEEIKKMKIDLKGKETQDAKTEENLKNFDALLFHYNHLKERYKEKRVVIANLEDKIKELQKQKDKPKV